MSKNQLFLHEVPIKPKYLEKGQLHLSGLNLLEVKFRFILHSEPRSRTAHTLWPYKREVGNIKALVPNSGVVVYGLQ